MNLLAQSRKYLLALIEQRTYHLTSFVLDEATMQKVMERLPFLKTVITNTRVTPASEDRLCGIASQKAVLATAAQDLKETQNIAEEFAILLGKLDQP